MQLEREFSDGNIVVRFCPNDSANFEAYYRGTHILAVKVVIMQDNKHVATYFKEWAGSITDAAYNSFVKNFLENKSYRSSLRSIYRWDGVICTKSNKGLNLDCQAMIERLNSAKEPTKKDYLNLKTFGKDSYSTMGLDKFRTILNSEDIEACKRHFLSEKSLLSALRWRARGLSVSRAIKKVIIDEEEKRTKYGLAR